ncbi:MAG: hypothetical protein IJW62_00230 [Clostridia bacterium]|nr:hypothetical protein [Clostridia bacterium]
MKIYSVNHVDALPCDGAVFVALGNFDGVHQGHAELLAAAREGAAALSTPERPVRPAVFTFYPLTSHVLTTVDERAALFAQHGIEVLFVAEFSAFCRQTPETFVRRTMAGIGAVGLVCGFNFRFGYGAAGDANQLRYFSAAAHMACRVISSVQIGEVTVSSTEIRRRLSVGNIEGVAALLGRPWSITEEVVHGRSVGGSVLSAPTLNLPIAKGRQLPPFGVYFTEAVIDGVCYPSVTNLGVRPTFQGKEILCETHLLEASGSFYGKTAEVRFLKFHRAEQRFDTPDSLAKAIRRDVTAARRYFDLTQKG